MPETSGSPEARATTRRPSYCSRKAGRSLILGSGLGSEKAKTTGPCMRWARMEMISPISAAMSQIQALISAAWSAIVSLIQSAMQQILSAVTSGAAQIVSAIVSAHGASLATVNSTCPLISAMMRAGPPPTVIALI